MRMSYKKGKDVKKKAKGGGSDFGMLSVKAGIDKNPNATQADRIAGATKGKKRTMAMNRAKKSGKSKPGKGSVTDKALKASAKTAKKPTKKA